MVDLMRPTVSGGNISGGGTLENSLAQHLQQEQRRRIQRHQLVRHPGFIWRTCPHCGTTSGFGTQTNSPVHWVIDRRE